MQSNILFDASTLPALPQPSLIDHAIFESPLPTAIVCLLIGAILFGSLRNTTHAKSIGLPAIGIGSLLAIIIFLLGQFITTDHEHLKERSAQIVQAAATADVAELNGLLGDNVHIQTMFASQTGKDRVLQLVQSRSASIVHSAKAKEVRAGLLGPQVARTQIKIRIEGDMVPGNSWWMIDWNRSSLDSDDWVAVYIEPIWVQGFSNPAGSK